MQSRRVTRCRTDDYSSTANSVNPSPKKQPRLNIPRENHWNANNNRNQMTDDGSLRKRTKVEERDYNLDDSQSLSDIQFIDCITPEHTMGVSNTIYACAQVHNPPSSKRSSLLEEIPIEQRAQLKAVSSKDRNSINIDSKNRDKPEIKENRFSYTGGDEKRIEDKKFVSSFAVNGKNNQNNTDKKDQKGRYSYNELKSSNGNAQSNFSLSISSTSNDHLKANENDFSKASIPTPSSPSKSPRYSLLVGETSSENSSSLNTPLFDMDMSSATQQFDQRLDELKKHMCGSVDTKELTSLLNSEENEDNVIIRVFVINFF